MDRWTSKENATLKHYRKLSSSAKARRTEHLYTLEGLRLVADGLESGADVRRLIWTETGLQRWQAQVGDVPAEIPGALIPDDLGKTLADTTQPQGVFAICGMPDPLPLAQFFGGGAYILLVDLQDPGNVGTILRTAEALGFSGAVCIHTADVWSPKVTRSTMGAVFRLPLRIAEDDVLAELAYCKTYGITTYATVVDLDATPITEAQFAPSAALVVGNEGAGLADPVARACDQRVTIPMRGRAQSLNAAMAAGIGMWEMVRTHRGEDV